MRLKAPRKTVAIADPGHIPLAYRNCNKNGRHHEKRNAKTAIGENVTLRKADIKEAKEVTVAPGDKGMMVQADPMIFKRIAWKGCSEGDIVVLGGAKMRRRTMTQSPYEDIFPLF